MVTGRGDVTRFPAKSRKNGLKVRNFTQKGLTKRITVHNGPPSGERLGILLVISMKVEGLLELVVNTQLRLLGKSG